MDFKNTNPSEHAFFTSLGYEERQYGYVRRNLHNLTTQVITPFDDYRFQVWAEYTNDDSQGGGSKIYNTGIVTFASFHQLQAVVILFEQIKYQEQ